MVFHTDAAAMSFITSIELGRERYQQTASTYKREQGYLRTNWSEWTVIVLQGEHRKKSFTLLTMMVMS